MMLKKIIKTVVSALLIGSVLLSAGCGGSTSAKGNVGEVTLEPGDVFAVIKIMDYGEITVKLFPDAAPVGVAKFIELANRGYYNGKNIHRIIPDYVIQGGSLNGDGTDGDVDANEYFPVEVNDNAHHFYGALCFAKSNDGNYCQFYFVNNKQSVDIADIASNIRAQLADEEFSARLLASDKTFYEEYCTKLESMSDAVKEKYKDVGGDFALDGESTVFGQTVEGFDVIDAISQVELVSGNKIDDKNNIDSKPIDSIIIESITIVDIPVPVTTVSSEETTVKTRRTKSTTASVPEETTVIITEAATSEITTVIVSADTSTEPVSAEDTSDISTTEPAPEISSDSEVSDDVTEESTDTSVETS